MSEVPKLVLAIDIQREYITPGRPYHIAGIEPSLANAKKLIDAARAAGVPVWHVHHQQAEGVFAAGGPETAPIEGFEPGDGEPVYVKDAYSSFTAPGLAQALAEADPDEITVVGYGTPLCCLSTIVDGIHRGYAFTLVEDAVAAKAGDHAGEEEMHRSAVNVIGEYARVARTDEVIERLRA